LYWLLGVDGLDRWHRLEPSSEESIAVMKDSGYVVGRAGPDWLCFDAGPIAHGLYADGAPSTAHGHLDTLQVLYCHDGEPVLIDSGMPFYFGDPEWVRHFRGPAAHNTIEIDGLEFARNAGGLSWSHVIHQPVLESNCTQAAWSAAAVLSLGAGNVVERYVVCLPNQGLWVADAITLDRPRRVRWHWQFASVVSTHVADGASGVFGCTNQMIVASWSDGVSPTVIVETANPRSPLGWRAPGYGERQPGCCVMEELPNVQRLLKVFYVGPSLRSCSVRVRNHGITVGAEQSGKCCQEIRCGSSVWLLPERVSDTLPSSHAAGTAGPSRLVTEFAAN
jgi:hypothetical protein